VYRTAAGSSLLIATAALSALLFINCFLINIDDVTVFDYYNGKQHHVETNFQNFRYIISAIANLYTLSTIHYSMTLGFWVIAYSVGVTFSAIYFTRYIGLSPRCALFITLAVGLHGFWVDLMQFTMGYVNYAVALFGLGLAFFVATRSVNIWYILGATTTGGLIVLLSYQPFILVFGFAVALAYVFDTLNPTRPARKLAELMPVVAGALLSCVAFLAVRHVVMEAYDQIALRGMSLSSALKLWPLYLKTIPDMFLGTGFYARIFPTHERLLYSASVVLLFILLAIRARRVPGARIVLAAGALLLAVAISANPMNLLSEPYWPSPRSLSPAAFLHAGMLAVLLALANHYFGRSDFIYSFAGIFLLLSAANQMSLIVERFRQTKQDERFGAMIVDDLRRSGVLADGARVGVYAEYGHIAQLDRVVGFDYGLSAFTPEWSRIPMLRMLSGLNLQAMQVPAEVCTGAAFPWEIRPYNGGHAVCLLLRR
jgi:hypothetical protein